MLTLYYKIWTDAITSTRAKRAEAASWKLYTIVPLSLLLGINLLTIFIWVRTIFNRNLPLVFPIHIFNYLLINDFISVIVTLFFPFVIFNYLLIFSNDRYKELLESYAPQNGKLYKMYALISLGILIIPIIIAVMFF